MLRPTYIDGDSVSIKEVVFLAFLTITNDFCERQKDMILFNLTGTLYM